MKLREAVDLFVGEYRGRTAQGYRDDMRMFMQYVAGGLNLTAITMPEVIRAVQSYEDRPTVKSPRTVNRFIRTVTRFFNWCVEMEELDKSPARKVQKRAEPRNDVLKRTMPEGVYFGLIEYYTAAATFDPKQNLRFLALLYFMGMSARRGGAAGVTWDDISYENREVIVTEKGGKTRVLFLDDDTIAVLRRWQLLQKTTKGNYVFSKNGGAISPHALGKFFRDYTHRAGYDKPGCKNGWGPQSLRHYVGIDLQDAGVNEIEAAGIMGHTVATYREHYASQDKVRLKEAAEKAARKRRVNRSKIRPYIDFKAKDEGTG